MKKISGSWIEFQHHNKKEGVYWNPQCKDFTEEQWEGKIKEIKGLGMEYLVLLAIALDNETYYTSSLLPKAKLNCGEPLEALLKACDKYDMKVFVSGGFFGDWTKPMEAFTSNEIKKIRLGAINEVAEKFGHHKSFYGWYWPDEAYVYQYFGDVFIDYVNESTKEARLLMPHAKTLIAPYGTRVAIPDEKYIGQLEQIDVDFIAYQDEVGVMKSTTDETRRYFEGLKKAHDKAGRSKLWADVEIFEFEGGAYQSPLIPADFARIEKQLASVSDYVDNILIYQYLGLMNKPGTKAFAGHENSVALYEKYDEWLIKNKFK